MTVLERMDPFLAEFDRLTRTLLGTPIGSGLMPMDVVRHGDEVLVRFDLPGIDPATVDLTLDGAVLTVSAERLDTYDDNDRVLVRERPSGRITRRVTLGEWIDTDHVSATYDAGVLTVHVPVREEARPRKIEVSAGEPKAIAA